MGPDPVERWRDLGAFIREQRSTARLSLRRLSELAGISNPYLSQIERGLRRPSADILQQIAKALRISAETLYVEAGILDPPSERPDLVLQILADPHLSEVHKQALVQIYLSFRKEGRADGADAAESTAHATPDRQTESAGSDEGDRHHEGDGDGPTSGGASEDAGVVTSGGAAEDAH